MSEIKLEPMTDEEIEGYILACSYHAMSAGFKSDDEMTSYKIEAAEGMRKFGGIFTHYLGFALAHADSENTAKLIKAFYPMCDEFREMFLDWMRKRGEKDTEEHEIEI
jgi:hypothetical protein